MFQYNNVLQSATVGRERKYVSRHSYFEQMREILTGVLISHRRGAEDTRVYILHVMCLNMQNGVKPPRVLIIET